MNVWCGSGNLTKDPESRTTSSGKAVTSFTIAINRGFGDKKEVDYIPIVTWNKLAETCAQWLSKGKKVNVSGRIQTRSYEAADGSKRYVTEIVANTVDFVSLKEEKKESKGSGTPNQFELDKQKNDDFIPVDDEEMPF